MNKKQFIAQQSGPRTIKIFSAETGQLYKVIDAGGKIVSAPICTETELYVGVESGSDKQVIKYFNVPTFSLKKTTSI